MTMNTFKKLQLKAIKHSPEIFVSVGVVGVVASTVLACKATTKINNILDERKVNIENIENALQDEDLQKSLAEQDDAYTIEDAKKDKLLVNAQTAIKLAQLYAPAIGVGLISLGFILQSNRILNSRNAVVSAAYVTLDKSIKEYRNRVIEKFGEQVDRELKYGYETKKVKDIVVDPETGKEKKEDKLINVVTKDVISEYAVIFDENCGAWNRDATYNDFTLRSEQAYANDLLRINKVLFLNEVYDRLGIPKTKTGQLVGWVYNPENNTEGDNYVDFRVQDLAYEKEDGSGYDIKQLLDFNVDGYILDLI